MSDPRSNAVRLSLLSGSIFAGLGIYQPFFPVFLAERGLTPDAIALVLFVPIVIRAISAPILAGLTDRRVDPALFLAIAHGLTACLYAVTALVWGLPAFLALAVFTALLQSTSIPLSDALTIKAAQVGPGLHYGRVRLWGSITFFIANLVGGVLLAHWGGVSIPLAIALCSLCVIPIVLPLRGMGGARDAAMTGPVKLGGFLFLIFVATALIQSSHAFLYAFGSLLWTAQGYGAETIGVVWALNILGEVALFWFFGSAVGPRFPAFTFILMGGVAAALRWMVMAFSPSPVLLVACQISHALSFGATHLGAIALVARFAPAGARGKAQGMMSAINGAVAASVTLMSGWLYGHFGESGYWAMVPLALGGVALASIAALRQPQSARDGG